MHLTAQSIKNKTKTHQYLTRVLNNQKDQKYTQGSSSTFGTEYFENHKAKQDLYEAFKSLSNDTLEMDVTVLLEHPNKLTLLVQELVRMQQDQLAYKGDNHKLLSMGRASNREKVLRLLILMAYTHPVMLKSIQGCISEHILTTGQQFDLSKRYNLETLTIMCAIPTFDKSLIRISQGKSKNPQTDIKQNTYEEALWINSLNLMTHGQFYAQWVKKATKIQEKNVIRVRNFTNSLVRLKEYVYAQIYQEISSMRNNNSTANRINKGSVKIDDNSDSGQEQKIKIQSYPQSNTEQQEQVKLKFSDFEIFLSFNNFVTTDYLPSSFLSTGQNKQGQAHIQIWIDRTVEISSLMGNFICKQKLGEFEYVRGPLMYAIQSGAVLILNNFEQISHELLVTMRTLATRLQITHNQKMIPLKSGFKIIGICSQEKRNRSKSLSNNQENIPHYCQPQKVIWDVIPLSLVSNQTNVEFIRSTMRSVEHLGLNCQIKLWTRMNRLRLEVMPEAKGHNSVEEQKIQIPTLWNGYLTENFKDQTQTQIQQLSNKIDVTRQIEFEREYKTLKIGRCQLPIKSLPSTNIVPTQYSLRILERLALCQQTAQTPLLISETGCGKTTLVQYLAQIADKKLYVYNMSSGTDVSDLVGGFKPIDCRVMLKELFYRFIDMFMTQVAGAQKNQAYINSLVAYFEANKLELLLRSLIQSIPKIKIQVTTNSTDKDGTLKEQQKQWDELLRKFSNIHSNLDKIDSNLIFAFMEGNLVSALKNGDWVLIDEINLASNDILQKIIPLIEGKSLMLYEKGDLSYIPRDSGFKIIACMNPANDSGKKALPTNLQEKFTSIDLSEPIRNDIEMMVSTLCPQLNPSQIADIYFGIKKIKTISLRNLSRSLSYINKNRQTYGWQRAMYDGLVLGYGEKTALEKYKNENPPREKEGFKIIHGFLVEEGPQINQKIEVFHLTKTFTQHLKDFLRAIAGTQLPVLLEGPTSAGKTSMIKYTAQVAGHKCIRINNHEHTQIEEYIGNYFPDKQGKLVFRQGPLVTAVRQGYWLILDELNLAKTQILQCLNRLLDDNRQLFIPEQQKHIKPHKNFRIFATQNPSSYSGRKTLSRAFRNRFIALMFDDITVIDTMAILQARRPLVSDSKQLSIYIKKVLQSLINYRQRQKVFSKDGLITMRDLLKWTGRKFTNKEMFIIEGYGILAQRLRTRQEKEHVFQVLTQGSKITQQQVIQHYNQVVSTNLSTQKIAESKIYVQMNKSFQRMSALTYLGVQSNEAILLVGQTGCGKTTLAQLLSYVLNRPFYSINCHKHTQAADLLGSLRPSTNTTSTQQTNSSRFEFVNGVVIQAMLNGGILLIDEINTAQDSVLERLNELLQSNVIGVERGDGWQSIKAKEGFCIIATMNPSGDYGKKELSPALRNRFTEIWVEPITNPDLIKDAQVDIVAMIQAKLGQTYPEDVNQRLSKLLYQFIRHYNCEVAEKYSLSRKRLTMRDIGWVCRFIAETKTKFEEDWALAYYWALKILAIEGLKFMMNDLHETTILAEMKNQLLRFIDQQCGGSIHNKAKYQEQNQLECINILKDMDFPLMLKTDLPLQLLGISQPLTRIFFSAHTDLSDLLGQYQPSSQNSFIWKDQQLLHNIRHGGRTILMDLNLAQQQVIEGVNSLFDYRGSIFVVELNETVNKHQSFKPIVVLKYTAGNQRRGLPNSFLNRFVKICVDDVSVDTKIKYLETKYPQIKSIERLIMLVRSILTHNNKFPIEKLELFCQICSSCPLELESSLEILQLDHSLKASIQKQIGQELSPCYLLSSQQRQEQISLYHQEKILSYLPLVKEFKLETLSEIKSLERLSLIYQLSSFSVCLVGDICHRDKVVEGLGYLLEKQVKKIILSTMTDMNDLLGTYEQITEQDLKTGNQMQQEITLDNVLHLRKSQAKDENQVSRKTKFVYQQSAIIKALRDSETTLLYIEVPNQILLERVEKGLKQIYQQEKHLILGIDSLREAKEGSFTTKFVPIHLNDSMQKLTPANGKSTIQESVHYFTQNLSNLEHFNADLRSKQLTEFLQTLIQEENSRSRIIPYKKLIHENTYQTLNRLETRDCLQKKEMKCRQKKIAELPFTYETSHQQGSLFKLKQSSYNKVADNKIVILANDFSTYKKRSLMQSFLGMTSEQISRRSNLYGRKQEELLGTINKFQILFICNINNFQQNSLKILSVIFSADIALEQSQNLLIKFSSEVQRLYEELFRDKIQEIILSFNDEETQIIPILSNIETIRFVSRLNNLSVRILSGTTPKLSMCLGSSSANKTTSSTNIEKQTISIVENLNIQPKQISQWVNQMRLRDLQHFEVLSGSMLKLQNDTLPQLEEIMAIMLDLIRSLPAQVQQYLNLDTNNAHQVPSDKTLQRLLSIFSPLPESLSSNISLHISNQLSLQTIKEVIKQDEQYLECYSKVCDIKYLGLRPTKHKLLNKSIESYQMRMCELAKTVLYRGHDNVKSLLEFYEYLMNLHQTLFVKEDANDEVQEISSDEHEGQESSKSSSEEEMQNEDEDNQNSSCNSISQLNPTHIKKAILESYSLYYDTYSDILLPYYLSLLLIYKQNTKINHKNKPLTLPLVQSHLEINDVFNMMDSIMERENQEEIDRAKDYIRLQRKFNKDVIVDQYTEEGLQKNKDNMEDEFNQLFGKGSIEGRPPSKLSVTDEIFTLLNKERQESFFFSLCSHLNSQCLSYTHLLISTCLTTSSKPLTNIYEQRHPPTIYRLLQPIPSMMEKVNILLGLYKIDTLKSLAGQLAKVYEHKVYKDEVYKVLVDCQFIIEQSFKLNAILPSAQRVPTDQLIVQCLKIRRIQLKNWKAMLALKQQRTQRTDMMDMVQFYKMVKIVHSSKQAFTIADTFLRESTICCLPSRMNFLDLLAKTQVDDKQIQAAIYRVMGFYQYFMPHVTEFYMASYNGKVEEMKEYQKLAGWNSGQYLIFKATCQKFQRKIHVILRKFDDQISMKVGTLIEQIKEKQLASSTEEFQAKLTKSQGFKTEDEDQQNAQAKVQENKQQPKSEPKKLKKSKKALKKQQQQAQKRVEQQNQYDDIISQIFSCLRQISQPYQNSQSKLRIIRTSLQQFEDLMKIKKEQVIISSKASGQHKYLTAEMFATPEQYQKTSKSYFGLWDKLCQRQETSWNRDVVERVWALSETIWKVANCYVPDVEMKEPEDQMADNMRILFKPYLEGKKQQIQSKFHDHEVFTQEVELVKAYLYDSVEKKVMKQIQNPLPFITTEVQSMIKMGYIVATIAVNLQKNGLCVKQDNQEGNESGTEQIGDGMGIGQGEIHQAAQNIGDQIEFEEQVQGNKQQKEQEQNNPNNKEEENDIDMEGQFDGEMYDKEQNSEEEGEGQSQEEPDEKMGSVDDDKRQEDMKNQEGQAQGKGQADVDIDGQDQGEEQLVDNERKKDQQKRKGQQQPEQQEDKQGSEAEQSERSDWGDNNEQGQKINKQDEEVQEHQRDQNAEDNREPQEVSAPEMSDGGESIQEENDKERQDDEIEKKSNQGEDQEKMDEENLEEQIQIQNDQEPDIEQGGQQEEQKKQDEKKQARNKKQYEKTFGRKDNKFQNNNLIKENLNDDQQQQNMGQGQQNQEGGGQGQKGAGKSVHSLKQEFLQQLMKKDNRSKQNEELYKNLDVRLEEDNDQDLNQDDGMDIEDQQYALTDQNDQKLATNLGLMMDEEEQKKSEEEKKKQKELEKEQQQNEKERNKKDHQEIKKDDNKSVSKKPSSQKKDNKDEPLAKNEEVTASKQDKQEKATATVDQSDRKPTVSDKKKATIDLTATDENKQMLIKMAVEGLGNEDIVDITTFKEHPHLISESYGLSKILQEQLKSVLEPLDQAEYKGDYKTGKKLNLKKIIPFIASNYRKDRIWLRRTQPSDRNYYVMLGLDDTKSMHYGDVGQQALKGLLAISMALQHLNIKTCVASIKDKMDISKNFDDNLNCQKILEDFSFQYESSNSHDLSMSSFMSDSLKEFEKTESQNSAVQSRQLCIIISDGKMNKQMVRPYLKEAAKRGITYVFIVIDSAKSSILNIKTVEYVNGKMQIKSYMSDFPFEYFLVINNSKELGDILGATLMQFIQEK